MGVFSPPNWNTLKNKPSTVAGFGISDMAAQVSANERCKAWVNFNGTGTVAIRAAFNVSSITDNGVGDYTVNFTAALADANYAPTFGSNWNGAGPNYICAWSTVTLTASSLRITQTSAVGALTDEDFCTVSVFR